MSRTRDRSLRMYWSRVSEYGCMVCRHAPATIHHVHGGSCRGLRGMGLKSNDWLVIPLCVRHHTGEEGIDTSKPVTEWEMTYGRQSKFLRIVSEKLCVDVLARAGVKPSDFDVDLPIGTEPEPWPSLVT